MGSRPRGMCRLSHSGVSFSSSRVSSFLFRRSPVAEQVWLYVVATPVAAKLATWHSHFGTAFDCPAHVPTVTPCNQPASRPPPPIPAASSESLLAAAAHLSAESIFFLRLASFSSSSRCDSSMPLRAVCFEPPYPSPPPNGRSSVDARPKGLDCG